MEQLYESLKFLFISQKITLLSVLRTSDFKPSLKRILTSLLFIVLYAALAVIGLFLIEPAEQINSHGQKVTLENNTDNVTSKLSIVTIILTWLSAIFYRKQESQYYQDLIEIDKILEKYGSLEVMYVTFSKASRVLFPPIVIHLVFYAVIILYYESNTIEMVLPGTIYVVMSIGNFMCSCCFYFNVKLLRDRFCLLKCFTRHCYTMQEFEDLERVHKSLIALMDMINDSMGIKVGFVLLANFLNAVTFSYTVFVGFIVPYPNPRMVYYNIFGVIIPHVTMLFLSFLSGEWVTTDVSVCLYNFKRKFVNRKLLKSNRLRTRCMP